MSLSTIFIRRPVATTLLAIAILISGTLAYFRMPVAPLPNIAFPVIVVQANMAGASPEIMASTVAEPLEKRLGAIADVSELTSTSFVGSAQIKSHSPIGERNLRDPIAQTGNFDLASVRQPYRIGAYFNLSARAWAGP